jgi:hypothetical protein
VYVYDWKLARKKGMLEILKPVGCKSETETKPGNAASTENHSLLHKLDNMRGSDGKIVGKLS